MKFAFVSTDVDMRSAGVLVCPRMLKVLVVDDEADMCELLSEALQLEGHEVTCARDGVEAMARASAVAFDVVLTDMRLPGLDGLTLFRELRRASPSTDVIVMTGAAAVSDAVAVLKEGAFDYLTSRSTWMSSTSCWPAWRRTGTSTTR